MLTLYENNEIPIKFNVDIQLLQRRGARICLDDYSRCSNVTISYAITVSIQSRRKLAKLIIAIL